MRIIGGQYHRHIVKVPPGLPVRPTTDKAKEALFNVLANYYDFEGLRVLDLFAGTGSISYEFASRGAQSVLAVDVHLRCTRFIKQVKERFGLDSLKVVKADVFRFLSRCDESYDIIFADPPYGLAAMTEIPDAVFSGNLLRPNGLLVMEHDASTTFDQHPFFFRKNNYSKVHFSFFGA